MWGTNGPRHISYSYTPSKMPHHLRNIPSHPPSLPPTSTSQTPLFPFPCGMFALFKAYSHRLYLPLLPPFPRSISPSPILNITPPLLRGIPPSLTPYRAMRMGMRGAAMGLASFFPKRDTAVTTAV
jgi:hypothetical protein